MSEAHDAIPLASEAELPAVLAAVVDSLPPRATAIPAAPRPITNWEPGQRETWAAQLPVADWGEVVRGLGLSDAVARYVVGDAEAVPELQPPTGPQIGVWRRRPWFDLVLGLGPEPVARLIGLGASQWRATGAALAGFVARYELDAVAAITALPASLFDETLPALLPIADVRIADVVARRWMEVGRDSERSQPAVRWLTAHPAHAVWSLIAAGTAEPSARSRSARTALRWLDEREFGKEIAETAGAFGVDSAALLAEEAKPVRIPSFWQLDRARPPNLRNGKQIPAAGVERLVTLLVAKPSREAIAEVTAACTEESLRVFALDIFSALLRGSSTSSGLWPHALAAFAGDAAIAPLVASLRKERLDTIRSIVAVQTFVAAVCGVLEAIDSAPATAALHALALRPRPQIELATVQDTAEATLERMAASRPNVPSVHAVVVPDPSFELEPNEVTATELSRFAGAKLSTAHLLPVGWRLPASGPGEIEQFVRPLESGLVAVLAHSGLDPGDMPPRTIKLGTLSVRSATGAIELGRLAPGIVGGLVREVAGLLAGRKRSTRT